MKFKVGEIVRQIKNLSKSEDPLCEIVEIRKIGKKTEIVHRHLNKDFTSSALEDNFEKVEIDNWRKIIDV